jgi:hypothetical protein
LVTQGLCHSLAVLRASLVGAELQVPITPVTSAAPFYVGASKTVAC